MRKRKTLSVMLAVGIVGLTAACSAGSGDGEESPSSENTKSTASQDAVDSHTFEGTGTKATDFLEDEDKVILSGEYDVRWEIKGNSFESSNGDPRKGPFELSFFCDTDPSVHELKQVNVANESLTEGSGDGEITVTKPQECQVNVVASDAGEWSVEVSRK